MSFLFVDRILALSLGQSIYGLKHISADDFYLEKESEDRLAFFPALIGETLGQLVAWNVMQVHQFKLRPVAGLVDKAYPLAPAYLGETVALEGHIESLDEKAVRYHAKASIAGKTIFEIENALGPLLAMEDFIDPTEAKAQFHQIYRPDADLKATIFDERINLSLSSSASLSELKTYPLHSDGLLELKPKEYLIAVKNLSRSAPYFAEHFPRKPVFPMTLWIATQMQLLKQFLAVSWPSSDSSQAVYRLQVLQNIKMKTFLQPGDSLLCRLFVKEKTEQGCIIQCVTELQGKKIGTLEMVLSSVLATACGRESLLSLQV